MHVHGLGGGVGARAVPESWEIEDFYAFPLFGLWCEGVRAAPESLEMQRILCISMWFALWGARAAPETPGMQRIPSICMVWAAVWRARAAPDSLEGD